MSKSKYVAVSEFMNGKQKHVKINSPISEDDYYEVTINHYLNLGCIAERKALKKASSNAKKVADEAEAKKVADEAEAKKVADEAEAKKVADEAESEKQVAPSKTKPAGPSKNK